MLKPFAFSNACKSYLFFCNASRHLWESHSHLVVEMQTLHGHSKQSGLGPVTFLQTKVTDKHAICVACSKTKIGNFGTFQKDYAVAANFLPKLQSFNWQMSSTILSANCGHIVPLPFEIAKPLLPWLFWYPTTSGQCIFICQCHQPNLYNKTQPFCPRMESIKNFSSYVYMYQSRP